MNPKLANLFVAFLAVCAIGAAHAQAPSPPEGKGKAAKKRAGHKAHKHNPGEKHRDGEDKPKVDRRVK